MGLTSVDSELGYRTIHGIGKMQTMSLTGLSQARQRPWSSA